MFVQRQKPIDIKSRLITGIVLLLAFLCQGCGRKTFQSDCNAIATFKHISFNHLVDSAAYYNHQYVEVSGLYKSSAEQSALFSDDIFKDYKNKNALWVNFTQDCPLYLAGTTQGLFSSVDGGFLSMNNRKIVIRGEINIENKGHLKQYRACLDHISLISF